MSSSDSDVSGFRVTAYEPLSFLSCTISKNTWGIFAFAKAACSSEIMVNRFRSASKPGPGDNDLVLRAGALKVFWEFVRDGMLPSAGMRVTLTCADVLVFSSGRMILQLVGLLLPFRDVPLTCTAATFFVPGRMMWLSMKCDVPLMWATALDVNIGDATRIGCTPPEFVINVGDDFMIGDRIALTRRKLVCGDDFLCD